MKICVCVSTSGVDTYGHLTRYAQQFENVARLSGIAVEVLIQSSPDFPKRLWANLSDEECIVHFYGYVFDLRVGANPQTAVNALEICKAKTVATIGDHPFSTFMHSTLESARPNTSFIVLERSFQQQIQTLKPELANARYTYQPIAPPVNYEAGRRKAFDEREYDLVVPMFMTDMSDRDIRFILSTIDVDWFARTVATTYEMSSSSIDRSPFEIFQECLKDNVGMSLSEIKKQNPQIISSMLVTVAAVDALVRQERRQRMTNAILQSVGNLKVAVTCDPLKALHVDENVQFVGQSGIEEVIDLMANAKAVLNCNPSYPSGLHERLVSGMFYEACVLTDVNDAINETFSNQEYVRCSPASSMTLQDIFQTYDIEDVASRGAQKVRGDRAFSWQAHFDSLLCAATA